VAPRIGLVIATSERGGFSAVIAEAHDLVARGVDVHVLSPLGPRVADLPAEARHTPLHARSRDYVRSMRQVRRWTRSARPDVVHVHGRASGITARVALAPTRLTLAYTPHGVAVYPRRLSRLADRVAQRFLRFRTTLYVMVGESEELEFAREHGFGGVRVVRMPNVIDPNPLREAGSAGGEGRYILVPGAYNPRKRFADIVEVAQAAPTGWTIRFLGHTEGGGEDQLPYLQERARKAGVEDRVSFEEESMDLGRDLAGAGLVLFPSETEGLPITALQALAVGVPVAWSDIPAHREIFGDEGGRFEVGDLEALGALLRDPEAWPSLAPRRSRADELFSRYRAMREKGIEALLDLAHAARGWH